MNWHLNCLLGMIIIRRCDDAFKYFQNRDCKILFCTGNTNQVDIGNFVIHYGDWQLLPLPKLAENISSKFP